MTWNFDDYSGNDDTRLLPLLISERTQQLLLAALKPMDSEFAWVSEIATWDETDAALGDAYTEILESVTLGTLGGCSVYSSVDQNFGSSTSVWHGVEFNETWYDTDDYKHGASITNFLEIPADGIYLIQAHVTFNANSSAETALRQSRILLNSNQILSYMDGSIVSRDTPHIHSTQRFCEAGDTLFLEILTTIPNLSIEAHASYSPMLTVERLR